MAFSVNMLPWWIRLQTAIGLYQPMDWCRVELNNQVSHGSNPRLSFLWTHTYCQQRNINPQASSSWPAPRYLDSLYDLAVRMLILLMIIIRCTQWSYTQGKQTWVEIHMASWQTYVQIGRSSVATKHIITMTVTIFSLPRCCQCNGNGERRITRPDNPNGNENRWYYECSPCGRFICFEYLRGAYPENPLWLLSIFSSPANWSQQPLNAGGSSFCLC